MTPAAFKRSLSQRSPPPDLPLPLAALWWAAKDDWDQAHHIVMDEATREAAWVHAYLHCVEGDLGNARYWYRRAQQPEAAGLLEAEWDEIAAALLQQKH